MAVNMYIGARYVPLLDGAWDSSQEYDPLVVVTYRGNSYTSKKAVPAGTSITNEEYWLKTGDYNAQVARLSQTVENYTNKLAEETQARIDGDEALAVRVDSTALSVNQRVTSLSNQFGELEHETELKLAEQDQDINAYAAQQRAAMDAFQNSTNAMISEALAQNASPTIVDSVDDMTNPSIIYLLSTNSHLYNYVGNEFVDSGIVYGGTPVNALVGKGTLPENTDLNNILDNGWYGLVSGRTYVNSPISSGTLICFNWGTITQQFLYKYIANDNGAMYSRRHSNAGWSEWIYRTDAIKSAVLDLQQYGYNVVSYQSGGISDTLAARPSQTAGYVLIDNFSDATKFPMADKTGALTLLKLGAPSAGGNKTLSFIHAVQLRQIIGNVASDGSVTWAGLKGGKYTTLKAAFFGDSIVAGRDGSAPAGTHVPNTLSRIVEAATGCQVDNYGIGSQGWVSAGSDGKTAYEEITQTDLTGYDYVFMMYGLNDSSASLGSYTDPVTASTIMGKLNKTVQYLAENYPTIGIVIISPSLTKRGSFPTWSKEWRRAGGWNQNEMNQQYKSYCDMYGIHYIDGTKGFSAYNVESLIGDYVHPTEQGYKILGNYIAAQLSSLL